MEHTKQQRSASHLKCLDKWTCLYTVIDSIHFHDTAVGIIQDVLFKVRIITAIEIVLLTALFIEIGSLFWDFSTDLSSEVDITKIMELEDILLEVVVDGPFRYAEFRVIVNYLIDGLTLFEQRLYDISDLLKLGRGHVYTFP